MTIGDTLREPAGASATSPSGTEDAKERASAVAGTAKDEAASVVAEGKAQAADLLSQLRGSVDGQVSTQRDRVVGFLRDVADELGAMSGEGERSDGPAHQLAREVAGRSASLADWMDGRQGGDLLAEVRGYARRKPGTFLLASAALGVAAGRLTRGAKAASGDGDSGAQTYPATTSDPAATSYPATNPGLVPGGVPQPFEAAPGIDDGARSRVVAAGEPLVDPYAGATDPYAGEEGAHRRD